MPTIYDNIENHLYLELDKEIRNAYAADFCVGYFRIGGWNLIAEAIDTFEGGPNKQCRLLIGMPFVENHPQEYARKSVSQIQGLKNEMKSRLRRQLETQTQSPAVEKALVKLREQLLGQKIVARVYTPQPLHAKLYLLYRHESKTPIVGYLGSSNLTFSGLKLQNELNVDVVEQDAASKLQAWFEERWKFPDAVDVSEEIVKVIEESWVFNQRPYYVYMKTVYHLCTDIREGGNQDVPEGFRDKLIDFQTEAFVRAVREMEKGKTGIMLCDVVGLGKTITASAIAKHFEELYDAQVVIFCPPNLKSMWERYNDTYKLKAKVFSHSISKSEIESRQLYKIGDFIVVDESHNFRNAQSKRYKTIGEYIAKRRNANPNTRVLLLTATPYNKDLSDIYAQLMLIVDPNERLPIKPEAEIALCGGETHFKLKHKFEGQMDTLAAFAKSQQSADWRILIELFMIRRTREHVKKYCEKDENGRPYLNVGGKIRYFPVRKPQNLPYEHDPLYEKLFSDASLEAIMSLNLPRYALGTYLKDDKWLKTNASRDPELIDDLKRAKTRLKGFCKTNFFKRLESCGHVFGLSLERHLLRNQVFLYALENGKDLPIGTLELNTEESNLDADAENFAEEGVAIADTRAREAYAQLSKKESKFRWAPCRWFDDRLKEELEHDCKIIEKLLAVAREWKPESDQQLKALRNLVLDKKDQKILVFTQFADTAVYLAQYLKNSGIQGVEAVTGDSEDPNGIVRRFSPQSNEHECKPDEEIRVLVSTDVLSEGHNLQDCHIVVNYDLPWAIVRLTQRMGRVDRIGQTSETVYCYSIMPAEGLENIIRLRSRLKKRLSENGEVVGTDEVFFEDDKTVERWTDLYREKESAVEDPEVEEVDLISQAYAVWKKEVEKNPQIVNTVEKMSYRSTSCMKRRDRGVIVYVRSGGADALKMFAPDGSALADTSAELLRKMACRIEEEPQPRPENFHQLVERAVQGAETYVGPPGGIKGSVANRVYERLKDLQGQLFFTDDDKLALDALYQYTLTPEAKTKLRYMVNLKLPEEKLMAQVRKMYWADELVVRDEGESESQIVCSMGLV